MQTHLQTLMYEHMCIPPIHMKTLTHVRGRLSVCAVRLYVRISVSLNVYIYVISTYVCTYIPSCMF